MQKRNLLYTFVATLILCLFSAINASAQETRGSIVGTVTDSSGAVLPGAVVELQPIGKKVISDAQGNYKLNDLAPGQYTLSVSYIGFASSSSPVTLTSGQSLNQPMVLKVGSQADEVLVSAERAHGQAEAINIERTSDDIIQVLPAEVITSLPNTNIADAVGRMPGVTLERDEGEGKYLQIRGTEPRLSNTTVNGVDLPSPEGNVRNIKLDIIPSGLVDRIELSKTLSASKDGDAIGGSVNLVTKSAGERPTYEIGIQGGYTPIQGGRILNAFDGTYGRRLGPSKRFGALLSGTYDYNERGIDDLEPFSQTGTLPDGTVIAYVATEDLRTYKYYRQRYGFGGGADYSITPSINVYFKGLFSDFLDYGDTYVYTPNAGAPLSQNGTQTTFDTTGNMQFREYIRRPDQQIFSILTGYHQNIGQSTILDLEVAGSHSHNNGGQAFATTNFNGTTNAAGGNDLGNIPFVADTSDPYRPKFTPTNGVDVLDTNSYQLVQTSVPNSHTGQTNYQGAATLTRYYSLKGHYGTIEAGVLFRNAEKSVLERDQYFRSVPSGSYLSQFLGTASNKDYYDGTYKYGPLTDYNKIRKAIDTNLTAVFGATDPLYNQTRNLPQDYSGTEAIAAGFIQNNINVGKFRIETGIRVESTDDSYNAYQLNFNGGTYTGNYSNVTGGGSYINVLPSVQVQYLLTPNTNIRASYGRGISRPNFQDTVPSEQIDPNTTPPSVQRGNPGLQPTKSNNYDILVEHYFQPLGVLQGGFFYKDLADPIFPTSNFQVGGTLNGYRINQSINGPNAYVYGFELAYEQHLSKLPGLLNGIGISGNYGYTNSRVSFPSGFNGGRTDHPKIQRQAPNTWNAGATYDKGRFSGRFGISHNDQNIYSYNYSFISNALTNDKIQGLPGPNGDVYQYSHTQYDLQANYRLYKGVTMSFSGLNLSNEVFGFYQGSGIYPIQREYYHPSYIFGLKWNSSGDRDHDKK